MRRQTNKNKEIEKQNNEINDKKKMWRKANYFSRHFFRFRTAYQTNVDR